MKYYKGFALDEKIREQGQSGGMISTLLIYMLEQKMVDGVIVTRWKKDNPIKPEMFIARSKEQVLSACKSKYCYVSMLDVSNELRNVEGRFVFVGTPCQIFRIKKEPLEVTDKIVMYLGLFCSGIMSPRFQLFILSLLNVKPDEVECFCYKDKKDSPVSVRLVYGCTETIPNKYRLRLKPLFTSSGCYKCVDHEGMLSDISFGDVWHPVYKDCEHGISTIVSRTKQGQNLLDEVFKDNKMFLTEIDRSMVVFPNLEKNIKKLYIAKMYRLWLKWKYRNHRKFTYYDDIN